MYNRKSVYTLNKEHPEAIVYPDALGKEVMLTSEQFASEEEFVFWKSWSDSDYTASEKICRKQNRSKVTLIEGTDADRDATVDAIVVLLERLENDEKHAVLMKKIREALTEKQYTRLRMYCFERMTQEEIARAEGVGQQRISRSIKASKNKITKIFDLDAKIGGKKA